MLDLSTVSKSSSKSPRLKGRDSCANAFITKMRLVVGLIPFFSKLLIASSLFMMLAPKKSALMS